MTFLQKCALITGLCLILITGIGHAQIPAFPDALGGGKYTTGGRGGSVYYVTNLNDAGPGSLRDAVSQGNRMILFKVSGIIQLKSKLALRQINITIAGQTAPGAGICVTGYPVNISANNIIIRYLRFRLGDVNKVEDDALNCFSGGYQNIIIDHCSMSWSVDETMSFYDVKNVTVQYCIISESLYNSYHSKGLHGYGGIFGGNNSSYLFNLIAHHTSRNPRFNGTRYKSQTFGDSLEFCNNVIYNWGGNSIYGGEGGKYNIINNYFKAGPATSGSLTNSGTSNKRNRIMQYTSIYLDGGDTIFGGKFYVNGNHVFGFPDVSADNWSKGVQKDSYSGAANLLKSGRLDQPLTISGYEAVEAEEAYLSVVQSAGASLPRRDTIDARIVRELVEGKASFGGSYTSGVSKPTGIIDKPSDVGGLPAYPSTSAPADTDSDGMPDEWETRNGLNPNLKSDGNIIGNEGYTHLEEYLYELTINSGTSTFEKNDFRSFQLYPTVTDGLCMIAHTGEMDLNDIQIFDALGRMVQRHPSPPIGNGNYYQLDLSGEKSGLYFVKITNKNNEGKTLKVVRR